jgi:predicted  nucleic acid-binding Zn-ribbon protein
MDDTIARLLELQELNITLRETEIVHGETAPDLRSLKERIRALRDQVSMDHLARFDRLMRQGLAVVRLHNDNCQGCNIGIARGDVNRMVTGKLEPICPHCGRFVLAS